MECSCFLLNLFHLWICNFLVFIEMKNSIEPSSFHKITYSITLFNLGNSLFN